MMMRALIFAFMIPEFALANFTPRWNDLTTLPAQIKQDLIEDFRDGNWSEITNDSVLKDIQKLNDGSSEFLLASSLLNKNYSVLSYAILVSLVESYPTSHLLDLSLEGITFAFQTGKIETNLLQEVFDKRIIKPQSDEAVAALQYHRGLTLHHKGFSKWAVNQLTSIPKDTFWKQYYDFMQDTRKSEVVDAKDLLSMWSEFVARENLKGDLKQRSLLNKARAMYELSEFKEAEAIYKDINLSRFDQGTVLRELGWLYYRTNRYKEALGMLNQLRSSVYGNYYHVDEYLLAALIYRENCQSELLKELSKSLEDRLKTIKKNIKQLGSYDNNPQVFQFAIHHPTLKGHARMMVYLNDEIKKARSEYSGDVLSLIEKSHKRLENYTMRVINRQLVEASRSAIEELLTLKDQIDYLSYSLQLRRFTKSKISYKEKVKKIRDISTKNQIVWPVYDEIWEDEIINFQSVLENQCQ